MLNLIVTQNGETCVYIRITMYNIINFASIKNNSIINRKTK